MKAIRAVTLASVMFAAPAMASDIYMDLNGITTTYGDGFTNLFSEFTINVDATSTYTDWDGNGVDVGDIVTDEGSGYVTGLVSDTNGGLIGGEANEGLNFSWSMGIDWSGPDSLGGFVAAVDDSLGGNGDGYCTTGETCGIGAFYNTGTITLSLDADGTDPNPAVDVMKLNVTSSNGSIALALLYGEVDFTGVDAIAQSLFYYADGTNVWDVWNAGLADPLTIAVAGRVDVNLDPPPLADCGPGCFTRTANLDGSYRLVPEPSILALFGIGLLGMAAYGRRRKV